MLLHFFVSDLAGNVPTLRLSGLIRNFFISDKYSKYSVGMLVDGMRPLLVPGFLFTSDDANRKVVLAG